MSTHHLSEQEIIRREKLAALQQLGIDAYPAPAYPLNITSTEIRSNYLGEDNKADFADVCLAGRLMGIRDMGKACFAVLQDHEGKIQIYVKRDDVCPGDDKSLYDQVWKTLDIGDIIGVKGYVFTTKTGETSVHVKELTLLSKSLKPLPVVKEKEGETFDAVTDPEFRYRQRYADLIINPHVKETFLKRSKLINSIKDFLNSRGAIEVDTPVLQSIPGGAAARPFTTHHNALDIPMYLRIANELYLKRLIVGGFDWVYEFSRNFRNEGMDRTHNPEFTVAPGQTVQIILENTDAMQHNLVITKPGMKEKVGKAGDAMMKDEKGAEKNYVPNLPEVLYAMPLVNPGQSYKLTFKAPAKTGDYPYVCTFPGHWTLMNGMMHVK